MSKLQASLRDAARCGPNPAINRRATVICSATMSLRDRHFVPSYYHAVPLGRNYWAKDSAFWASQDLPSIKPKFHLGTVNLYFRPFFRAGQSGDPESDAESFSFHPDPKEIHRPLIAHFLSVPLERRVSSKAK